MSLITQTRILRDVAVVSCRGQLEFGSQAVDLHLAVKTMLESVRHVVLDLAAVDRLDSAGIGTLFAIYTSALNAHATMALAALQQRVRYALDTAKLLSLVRVFDSVDEAVLALKDNHSNRVIGSSRGRGITR